MTRVFLDTSALIELTFWDAEKRRSIRARFPPASQECTSTYVVFEVARGFLRNLILLHNQSYVVSRFSDIITFGGVVWRKHHYSGTISSALADFMRGSPACHGADDQELLDIFRGYLRGRIRLGWRQLLQSGEVINPCGCKLPKAPAQNEDGSFDQTLSKNDCGKRCECGLKAYIEAHRPDFVRLRTRLQSLPNPDVETTKRIRSLRALYRVPNRDFDANDCYDSSDAIIAHECPASATLLTKNGKHFTDACDIFEKKLISYV